MKKAACRGGVLTAAEACYPVKASMRLISLTRFWVSVWAMILPLGALAGAGFPHTAFFQYFLLLRGQDGVGKAGIFLFAPSPDQVRGEVEHERGFNLAGVGIVLGFTDPARRLPRHVVRGYDGDGNPRPHFPEQRLAGLLQCGRGGASWRGRR